ncbi:MAG: hypothetical protein HYX76_13860 [Acidobacteria bacterium]|nr:hypothetical protein [Acidobacteriota bacterium]
MKPTGPLRWMLGAVLLLAGTSPRAQSPIITFDRYHTYADFTDTLQRLAREYPNLVSVAEAGKSLEGRSVWAVTITNRATGAPEQKPGMYVDGSTHAGEVTGGEAALHLAHSLATQYGKDPLVTEALDTRTYYVIPRVNPDGAEIYLTGKYPKNPNAIDDDRDGRVDEDGPEDLNGDGVISYMRIRDPNGPFRTDPSEPRLMQPRKGSETGEWRIVGQEGTDNDGDGRVNEDGPEGLGTVSNRNYPVGWWSSEEVAHGQGRYPLSEPEAKAQVDWVLGHPNINGLITYHTHSGLILRPYAHHPDDALIRKDLPYFEGIGAFGTEITGYKLASSYADFTPDPSQPRQGTFKDWAYVNNGIIAWTIEIWKAPGEEGLSAFTGLDQRRLVQFVDQNLGGRGIVPWKPYKHPTYGDVEIGGVEQRFVVQNPPPEFLEKEISKVTRFAIVQGLMSPLVRVVQAGSEDLGGGIFRVRAGVQNQGYLPTAIPRAEALKIARPVTVSLGGSELLSEPGTHEIGTLPGWGPVPEAGPGFGFTGQGAPVKRVSWIVRGKPGDEVTIRAGNDRGGRHERKLRLEARRVTN